METTTLIDQLSRNLKPVKVLATPWKRWLYWSLGASLLSWFAAMGAAYALWEWKLQWVRLEDPSFLVEQMLVLSVGLLSGLSALMLSVPGRVERWYYTLPVVTGLIWFGLAATTFDSFIVKEVKNHHLEMGYHCLFVMLLSSLPAGALLSYMVKKGAAVHKAWAGLFTLLATTSMGTFGLQFFCPNVSLIFKLVWHVLPIYAVAGLGFWLGPRIFNWDAKNPLSKPLK